MYSLVLLLLFHCYAALAQKQVHFVVKYLPQHSYVVVSEMSSYNSNFDHDKEDTKPLKDSGKTSSKMWTSHSEMEVQTGELYNDSLFSMKVLLKKIDLKVGLSVLPRGSIVYGTCSKTGRVVVDSLVGDGLYDYDKHNLLPKIETLMQNLTAPEHIYHIGDSLTYSWQMRIPVPLGVDDAGPLIYRTYKLKSISGGIANFEMTDRYIINSKSGTNPAKMAGSGQGRMSYDIKNCYFTNYESAYSMDVNSNGKSVDTRGGAWVEKEENKRVKLEENYVAKVIIGRN